MNYEKNIPTQQTTSQKNPRFPQADEDRRRTKSSQAPPQQGTQNSLCVKLRFEKRSRLLKRSDFLSMKRGSVRSVGKTLCVDIKPAQTSSPRMGITASTKYGSSCERNRFKRLVREAFRLILADLPHVDVHVVPRQRAKGVKLADILADLSSLVGHHAATQR